MYNVHWNINKCLKRHDLTVKYFQINNLKLNLPHLTGCSLEDKLIIRFNTVLFWGAFTGKLIFPSTKSFLQKLLILTNLSFSEVRYKWNRAFELGGKQ